jgi:hypothetical protein
LRWTKIYFIFFQDSYKFIKYNLALIILIRILFNVFNKFVPLWIYFFIQFGKYL